MNFEKNGKVFEFDYFNVNKRSGLITTMPDIYLDRPRCEKCQMFLFF